MENSNFNENFFVKVINKDLKSSEQKAFEEWINSSEANRTEFEKFVKLWNLTGVLKKAAEPDADILWQNISNSIKASKKSENVNEQKIYKYKPAASSRLSNAGAWIIRFAAIIVLTALVIFFKDKTPVHSSPEMVETPVEKNEIYTMIVHRGESRDIRLADGSIVKLNSESKLLYPRYFEGDERVVELSGEAFFMIKSNKNKPFKVKIGDVITEVVGTEFNIKARANEDIELVVVQGSVKVYNERTKNTKTVKVNPGELLTYSENKGFSNPRKAELKHYTAWLQNKISFRNEKLGCVMEEIERIYNVNVRFQDNDIETKRLTGTFTKKSLNETLTAISISMNINIVYEENTIFISNNN